MAAPFSSEASGKCSIHPPVEPVRKRGTDDRALRILGIEASCEGGGHFAAMAEQTDGRVGGRYGGHACAAALSGEPCDLGDLRGTGIPGTRLAGKNRKECSVLKIVVIRSPKAFRGILRTLFGLR